LWLPTKRMVKLVLGIHKRLSLLCTFIDSSIFCSLPLGGSWRGLSFQHLLTCFTPFTVRIFLMSCSSFEVSSTITVRVPEKSPS